MSKHYLNSITITESRDKFGQATAKIKIAGRRAFSYQLCEVFGTTWVDLSDKAAAVEALAAFAEAHGSDGQRKLFKLIERNQG